MCIPSTHRLDTCASFYQLSAIMEKTGTKVDLLPHRARRHRIRERQRLGQETMATTCGPTCLIACPKVLIDNVSVLVDWFVSGVVNAMKADRWRLYDLKWLSELATVSFKHRSMIYER